MDKRCTVCNHSQAHDINLALLAGTTLDTLKQQFGLSRSALHRHKLHLQRTIDQAEDRMRHNFMLSYLFQLNDYNDAAAATMAAARDEGNARLTLQAANAGTRIINTMARFEVDLDHETIYRLLTSPQYVQSGCLLPGDPHILAGPRQNLVRSLAAACPETAVGALFDPEDVAAYLKLAQEPDANTYLPPTRQLELSGFLIPLADVLPAASDSQSTADDRQPKEKRDGSGTEAGQTSPLYEFIEENQIDMQVEQISETNLVPGPSSDPLLTAHCLLPTAPYPPLNDAGAAPETLVEAQAAELAEYLTNFSPYAKPAPDPASDLSSPIPGTCFADPKPKPPPPYDETARRADELFEMAHGYKRSNPPKNIPYRHRDEDFRSNSIFGDPSKIYG